MKLLHIQGGREGGAERFFVRLVNALGARGVRQMALIRPSRLWRDEIDRSRCEVHEDLTTHRRWLTDMVWPYHARRRAVAFRPDVVMSWLPSKTARFLPPTAPLRVARLGGYYRMSNYGKCDLLICNTPGVVAHAGEAGWRGDRVELISNFVDPSPVRHGKSASEIMARVLPDGARIVLSLGRLEEEKGFDILVRAMRHLRDDTFLAILGEGRERTALERLARELGVSERVRLPGWIQDPSAWIAGADVFACSSRREPLGNVILEAWGAGRPVVATDSPGPRWLIGEDAAGLLTPVDQPEPLAAAIARLLADPALGARLAMAGRRRLDLEFSEETICRRYIDLFQQRLRAPMRRERASAA